MAEIWTICPYFEDFLISNHGRFKNEDGTIKISNFNKNTGYLTFSWYCKFNKKRITKEVHRLVAETFINNPNNYRCVDHIDGNKLNNRVDNLRWVSNSINVMNSPRYLNAENINRINNFLNNNPIIYNNIIVI